MDPFPSSPDAFASLLYEMAVPETVSVTTTFLFFPVDVTLTI